MAKIEWRGWTGAAFGVAALMLILVAMGRPPICPCGTVSLWHGVVQSNQNSQQISDWYSFSHIIHGFLFLFAARALAARWPRLMPSLGVGLIAAVVIEGSWEILENSPIIIDRYREVTMAYGYSGDSILNSVSDTGFMVLGFWAASKLRAAWVITLAVPFELFTLATIRDNLTLNVLMLVSPVDAIRDWQAAG